MLPFLACAAPGHNCFVMLFSTPQRVQVADSSASDGIRLKAHHYSDREPWACLRDLRDSDYDLHWESRRSTAASGRPEGADTQTHVFRVVRSNLPEAVIECPSLPTMSLSHVEIPWKLLPGSQGMFNLVLHLFLCFQPQPCCLQDRRVCQLSIHQSCK